MQNREWSKITMYFCVKHNLREFKPLWENKAFFVTAVNELHANMENLQSAAGIQCSDYSGFAIDKNNRRATLIDEIKFVCSITQAYATVIDNTSLFNEMKTATKKLKQRPDKVLIFDAYALADLLTEHLEGLDPFSITQEVIDRLRQKTDDTNAKLILMVEKEKAQVDASAEVKRLLKSTDTLLKNLLDKYIYSYRITHHDFQMGHIHARRIIDVGSTKRAMDITVIDIKTGLPLPGVVITIKYNKFKRKTSPQGKIQILRLKPGSIILTASTNGYEPKTTEVQHVAGETTKVRLEMRKL